MLGIDEGKSGKYEPKNSYSNPLIHEAYVKAYEEGYAEGKAEYVKNIRQKGKEAAFGNGMIYSTYTQEQKSWYEEGFEEGKKNSRRRSYKYKQGA